MTKDHVRRGKNDFDIDELLGKLRGQSAQIPNHGVGYSPDVTHKIALAVSATPHEIFLLLRPDVLGFEYLWRLAIMSARNSKSAIRESFDEISTLVRRWHETEQRLHELVGDELETVLRPGGQSCSLLQAQEKLRGGEVERLHMVAKLASVLDAVPANVALIDQKGVIVSVNEGWREFGAANGYQNESMGVGSSYIDICDRAVGEDADEADSVADGIRTVLSGETDEFALEYPCHGNGEERWFRLMVKGSEIEGVNSAVVMHVDVSAIRAAQKSASMRASILDDIGRAVIAIDADGKINYVNRFAEELFEWSSAEMMGKYVQDVVAPQFSEEQAKAMKAALESRKSWAGDVLVQNRSGRIFHASVSESPLFNEDGGFIGVAGIFCDITERLEEKRALLESESRFAGAFEAAPIGMALVSLSHRMLKVNRALCQMLGYSESELLELTVGDVSHPDDLAADMAQAKQVIAGERETYQLEKRLIHRDQHSIPTHLAVSLVRDTDGTPLYFISQVIDISARTLAERNLIESQQRLALATQSLQMGIWDWDLTTGAMIWNDEMFALYGIRAENFTGDVSSWQNGVHPDDRLEAERGIGDALEKGEDYHGFFRVRWPAGDIRTLESHAVVQRAPNGKAIRMTGVNWDISERKEAERRVAEQAALLDMAPDAILVRDLSHRMIYWNKSAERLFGWSNEEIKGRPILDLLRIDEKHFREVDAIVREHGEWSGELQKTTRAGVVLTLDSRWTLVRDSHGTPTSILVIDTDITERKKLEQQFLRSQRMESIGTLAGGIAHDLNNSLAPILMSIELLKLKFTDPESLALLNNIGASADRGADMVRQLLSYARGVSGKRIEVEVGPLLSDIEKIIRDTFLKNIEVRCVIPESLWSVRGDATQLHQVLLNLCINARDAMPDGGSLTLTCENITLNDAYLGLNTEAKAGPYVVLHVEDTGTGMPADVIEKIFDPFFTTKELGKGTGLGLSTSLGIVKSHGGYLRVYSEPGKGTRFCIYLPALMEGSHYTQASMEAEMPRGNGQLVLVVDDEPSVRQITQETLEAFGYRVCVACDGAEAIAVYASRSTEIALIITDMMMPNVDGATAIQVLLRMNPALPIIAASGLSSDAQTTRATSLGVRNFLPKPYTASTMLKMIRDILTT